MVDYCTVDDVKGPLQIDLAETKYDIDLARCVTTGSAIVDASLQQEDLTVPSTVPQLVKEAAAHYAAWEFRRWSDPLSAGAFWGEAERLMDKYIRAKSEPYVGSV